MLLDTLDLQDTASPTAQDHTRQPTHPAPLGIGPAAPHQQAALHHVQEERASEEEHLEQAWHSGARADPPSDDEHDDDNQHYDAQAVQQNGGSMGGQDDQDMADGDTDDGMDDDMMDKISSSPSIDDGGFPKHSTPKRRQFHSVNQLPTPSPTPSCDSSPFQSTPQHLPLGHLHLQSHNDTADESGSSPYTSTPDHHPFFFEQFYHATSSQVQHHHGEYVEDTAWSEDKHEQGNMTHAGPRTLDRDISASSLGEEAMNMLLLPADDPLLLAESNETSNSKQSTTNEANVDDNDEIDDDDAWETESSENDDDSKGLSLLQQQILQRLAAMSPDLPLTEDIDFEFVYALHTFVATVEGQANATKGDTMVLLDDSNSYWWLVRIVKDSSIGKS